MAKRKTRERARDIDADLLSTFLANVDRFTETVSAQILAVTGEAELRPIIESTGQSYVAQTRRLTDFIREVAAGMAPGVRRELDQFLRVQDGDALVERALIVSAKTLTPGRAMVTMGFLSWLDEIMNTIKKIIKAILNLIFGGHPPSWIDDVLVIIDELLNLLKTLLGGVFGLRMSEVADQLSREEVNFLREMTALAELHAAERSGRNASRRGGRGSDDDGSR